MLKPFFIFSWIICCCLINTSAFSQSVHDQAYWNKLFQLPSDREHNAGQVLYDSLQGKTKDEMAQMIRSFESDRSLSRREDFPVKMSMLKALYCRQFHTKLSNQDVYAWTRQALKTAIAQDDDYLTLSVCFMLGDLCLSDEDYDTGIFYMLKGVELQEKLGYKKEIIANSKISVSNILYRTENFN